MNTLDEYEYPKQEILDCIANYQIKDIEDYHMFMELIKSVWYCPEYFSKKDDDYYLSTGGWSGNEEIIAYMKMNHIFWMFYWEQSNRGGHHIFCPIDKMSFIGDKNETIFSFCRIF
jgi:hypothetical protein